MSRLSNEESLKVKIKCMMGRPNRMIKELKNKNTGSNDEMKVTKTEWAMMIVDTQSKKPRMSNEKI